MWKRQTVLRIIDYIAELFSLNVGSDEVSWYSSNFSYNRSNIESSFLPKIDGKITTNQPW